MGSAANTGTAWRLLNASLLLACLVLCVGVFFVLWGWHAGDLMPLSLGLMMVILAVVFGIVLGFIRAAFNVLPPKP